MKVEVVEGGLVARGRGGGSVRFCDVAEVAAEKVGRVPYDELFLIVRGHGGDAIILGELDEGFGEAERSLQSALPGFPARWSEAAEQLPVGARIHVWAPRGGLAGEE